MRKSLFAAAVALALAPASVLSAQESAPPGPGEIVNAAAKEHWVAIEPEELVVMTLAPDAKGGERQVLIQLMPPPFSQGWVANIRTLARAGWYNGISINRVQDNYVVQWGDPGHDNPEGEGIDTKPLPDGLIVPSEEDYVARFVDGFDTVPQPCSSGEFKVGAICDPYAELTMFRNGWPVAMDREAQWPVHCYGMVGVGRNFSPDTGTGAELYTVIGHAPRHLDRNIALVGRIIGGMEHLSSLPRGSGALGFYTEEEAEMRTPILSVRIASDLPEDERPHYEYLATDSASFAAYAQARANRRDPFFIVPAGGADICNIPVPVRAMEDDDG